MITVRQGSQVHSIIVLLALAGEYPMYSVKLIGNQRIYKRKITELTKMQSFRNPNTGEVVTTKLLNISGKGKEKTIRLYKGALPILKWLGLDEYYQVFFNNHVFSGQKRIKLRNHRVAEVLALCWRAGIGIAPDEIPILQDERKLNLFVNQVAFYTSKHLKRLSVGEMSKIKFTRLCGAVIAYDKAYAVYNLQDTVMRWNGCGEFKTKSALSEISRMNASEDQTDSAILFGTTDKKALESVLASEEKNGKDFRLDVIYDNVYFIPLDEIGVRLLQFFRIPNWQKKLQELLFDESERLDETSSLDCDAYVDGVYIFSYLDTNMARLIRFRGIIAGSGFDYEIVCYPFQVKFIKEYFGNDVQIKTIELDVIEQALGVKEVK